MFEQHFQEELAAITDDKRLIEKFWNEIKFHYSNSGRHYHNLSHLDNLVDYLSPVIGGINDWQTLVFSIAYHDIIYNTLRSDNEDKSAQLAYKRLSELYIPPGQRDKCCAQIMATKGHIISEDSDTNYFTDADLAVLGSNSEEYQQYSKMIRKEYKYYPDFLYKPGRQKVIRHFIDMPRIYKTDFFRHQFEEQARINLNNELMELSA